MNNNFLPYQLKKNSEQANTLATQLAQITTQVNALPYFDVQQIKNIYYPNDTDYTNAFNKAVSLAGAQTNYLYARILFSRNASNYIFNNSTPIVLKNNVELVFEEGAQVQYTGSGTSLFTNDPTTASLFLILTGKGRMITNANTLFYFRYSKAQTYGFNIKVNNMKFVGPDSTRTGKIFDVGWTDFLRIENSDFNNLAQAVNIYAYAGETRGNTQIHFDNVSMVNVGTGVEFAGLDKATFRGVDIAQCGIGFLGHSNNLLPKFINCHVELYDQYAYKYDGDSNINNSFDNCSCFNPTKPGANGGFYSAQLGWSANGQNFFSFRDCDFVKASWLTGYTNYVPFFCPSPFEWHGVDFEHQGFQNVQSTDYPPGGAKIYTAVNRATSRNLLSVSNLNDTTLLNNYQGTATITADTTYYNGVHINWVTTASGQVLQLQTKQALNVGWHTLIIKGSQLNFNNFNVVVQKPDFTFLQSQAIIELFWNSRNQLVPGRSGLKTQTLTIPFYVSTSGTHYVSFTSNGATTYDILLGSIALVAGFATDYHSGDRVWYKSAIPTGGYWYQDDIIYNTSRTSGQPIGWKCSASGSPGTWLSLGNYA